MRSLSSRLPASNPLRRSSSHLLLRTRLQPRFWHPPTSLFLVQRARTFGVSGLLVEAGGFACVLSLPLFHRDELTSVRQFVLTIFSTTLLSGKTAKRKKIVLCDTLSALAAELGTEGFSG